MPPLPKPRTGGAPKKGSRSRPSTGTRERGAGTESSSAPPTGSRSRTNTRAQTLQDQLTRMYAMMGMMIRPFGKFYPVLDPVGVNLVEMSEQASEAWMDLAQKDKRVLEILESITGASTWGNVIGIHLAIFASALPGAGYMQQVTESPQWEDELTRQGRAMGMSDEEIAEAKQRMQTQQPVRDTSTGGPGDTVAVAPAPEYQQSAAPVATAAPAPGIVTPEQLGVTQLGEDQIMPADFSPPNGSAA